MASTVRSIGKGAEATRAEMHKARERIRGQGRNDATVDEVLDSFLDRLKSMIEMAASCGFGSVMLPSPLPAEDCTLQTRVISHFEGLGYMVTPSTYKVGDNRMLQFFIRWETA